MLVVFSGGSGVGKNTVIEHLLKEGGYELMPTYTTRQQRPNESVGNPYYFITEDEFKEKIASEELFEYNIVHGNYYGTSRVLYEEKIKSGKVLLKDIDVMGTQNLVETLGKQAAMLTIFLRVDSKEVLVERLKGRKELEIDKRLQRYDLEQTYQTKYDYIITNNTLEETLGICRALVAHAKSGATLKATREGGFDEQKVRALAALLAQGEQEVAPIDVAIRDGELYIVDGHLRYLASKLAGKKVAVSIVTPDRVACVPQDNWNAAVAHYQAKE